MSVIEERLSVLDSLVLGKGSHASWEEGACVMEAVSYIAGEPWSDHPKCASKVITAFLVSWNDALPDDERQILKPLIPRLVGTRTMKADETKRAYMAADWLTRECVPAFLRAAGLTEHAELLENLAALTDAKSAKAARATVDSARDAARAKRDEAWRAAGAAWAAEAAGAAWAAGAAEAAWAAWAAGKRVKDEGGDYWAQRDAAKKAARPYFDKAFKPITTGLQVSAYQLIERMCEVGREAA